MKFEKRYIILILLLSTVLNWVVEGTASDFGKATLNLGLIPKKFVIIIEILQVLVLLRILMSNKMDFRIRNVLIGISAIVGFELAIHFILGHNITIWISGIRYYFSSVTIFIIGYLFGVRREEIQKIFQWLLLLIFLQVPITIYQFFVAANRFADSSQLFFDTISGTMGGFAPNLMSVFVSIGFAYYLIQYLNNSKLKNLVFMLLLLIPPVISETKGMFVLILVFVLYVPRVFEIRVNKFLAFAFIGLVSMSFFTVFYNSIDFGSNKSVGFVELLEYSQLDSGRGRLSRIESVGYAANLILEEESPLFGMGIGSANSNPLGSSLSYNDFFTIRHSVDTLITETGILGAILLIYFCACSYRYSIRIYKRRENFNNFEVDIAKLTGGLVLMFFVSLFWTDTLFRVQFMYPFGLLVGYVYGLNKSLK